MRTRRDSTTKGPQRAATVLLDDGERTTRASGSVKRTANFPAMFGCDGLKTENEKEQGNGSGSFFTSTWSSATGRGQLARTSSVTTAAALQARRDPKRAAELARQGGNAWMGERYRAALPIGLDREAARAVFMRGDVLGGTADMARDGTGVGRRRHGLRLGYGARKKTPDRRTSTVRGMEQGREATVGRLLERRENARVVCGL